MTLFLSVPDALSQLNRTDDVMQAVRQPWTIPLIDATEQSYGYRQEVNLRSGLNVLIDDYTLHDDLVVETGSGAPCDPCLDIEISFMLSSHNRLENVASSCNFFEATWSNLNGGQFYWQAGERVLKFDIHIESDLFAALVGEQLETLPLSLKRLMQQPQSGHGQFWHTQPTTAAMQSAIHQILHCPYQGLTRWLYWEGKVLELIALRLEQIRDRTEEQGLLSMKSDRRDRLYHAQEILRTHLDTPPSVLELAQAVGLNHNQLKQGFRQVFGTTVFGYLKDCRLEKARHLLSESHLNVAAVASEVGYANAAKFASVFKRKFGITPSAYRSGEKLEKVS